MRYCAVIHGKEVFVAADIVLYIMQTLNVSKDESIYLVASNGKYRSKEEANP